MRAGIIQAKGVMLCGVIVLHTNMAQHVSVVLWCKLVWRIMISKSGVSGCQAEGPGGGLFIVWEL